MDIILLSRYFLLNAKIFPPETLFVSLVLLVGCRPNEQLDVVVRADIFHVQLHDVVQRSNHSEQRKMLGNGERQREKRNIILVKHQTVPHHGGLY